MVQPHGHNSDHVVLVLEGSMTCGGVECGRARTSRSTRATTRPSSPVRGVVGGDDGRPRSFPARQGEWHALLAERDVRLLPNPPIDLPGGLADTRN